MTKKAIRSVADFEAFFTAYNERNWDVLFQYVSDDCLWNASEKCVQGRQAMVEYWTGCHKAIRETLGSPQQVVFGGNMAYLQVPITMEFLEDGSFFGKDYPKGSVISFWCADAYTFDDDGVIKECRVYTKFE